MSVPRGRPFEPGNKFGKGRPKGSPNKKKNETSEALEEYAPHVLRKSLGMGLEGNVPILRKLLDKILPTFREATFKIRLPRIKTAADAVVASNKVLQAVAQGKITPTRGEQLTRRLGCGYSGRRRNFAYG